MVTTTKNFPNGVGVSLDAQRRNLPTRQRSWLGRPPRNSTRQIPLAAGMEGLICTGDFVSLNEQGRITSLTIGTLFLGVLIGVGSNPHPVGSVRIGKIWEQVAGLTMSTPKETTIYADPSTQALNISTGIPIGRLENVEEFGSGLRAHVALCTDIPGRTTKEESPTLTVDNQKGFQ